MKVLVAEDDHHMRRGILEILETEGYDTVEAADGETAFRLFEAEKPSFVCLDIMMPGLNGYDVCRRIRQQDESVPIVFLSAKSEEIDKVLGLELGADDYIMKPFGMKELIARIRAISRRALRATPQAVDDTFSLGDLTIMSKELRGQRNGMIFDLSLREVRLLRVFFENPGQVLDRDRLFEAGWGTKSYPNSRTLDQHVSKLRKKIEADPKNPTLIQTVHGVGYRWEG